METIRKAKPLCLSASLVLGLIISSRVSATDGYFAHGYGVKSLGMGGVGIALPQDSIAAALNPAGLGLVGDRSDLGLTWFKPDRGATITAPSPAAGKYDGNDNDDFFIPEFGYNRKLSDRLSAGVSVYGNGGMNTDYKDGIPLLNGGTNRRTGIDYAQLFIAPTLTWKVTPGNTLGIAVNLAYQRFEAQGLQSFSAFSAAGNNLTNKRHDNSYGIGLHLGWIGEINDVLTVGLHYQTKTWMRRFDRYEGLFAEKGDLDVPSTYGIGVAVKATPQFTIAADVQRILYSDVHAIGNPSLSNLFAGNPIGSENGPGFGWRDVTVYKLGASYAVNESLTLRLGYNHSTQPIRSTDTLFNILAPGVVQDHLTVGGTYTFANKNELSFFYAHAFENEVKGTGSIPPGPPFGGGEANIRMQQNTLGIAYAWKF